MPNPFATKVIWVKFSSVLGTGHQVRFYNTRTGEIIMGLTNSAREVEVDLGNTVNGWQSGDTVLVKVNGDFYGQGTLTLDATGGQDMENTISLTQTSTTNCAAIL